MESPSTLATYLIQYVGCIPITVSIKSLNFQERTQITRECIVRVCEDVGLRVPPAKSHSNDGLSRFIGKGTDLKWTRQSVRLTISVDGVTVQNFHSNQVLFHHRLSAISFASSGEADMMDFVSYVAKIEEKAMLTEGKAESEVNGKGTEDGGIRRCYVFYCSGGCSRDFIASIGEAFKLGYKGFRQGQRTRDLHPLPPRPVIDDLDPPLPKAPAPPVSGDPWLTFEDKDTTLNSRALEDRFGDSAWLLQEHPVSTEVQEQWTTFSPNQQQPAQSTAVEEGERKSLEPVGEPWYVGQVTRQKAEALLQYDGDFLVRASTQQPNQFVLSGMQNGKKRHLLLINPRDRCLITFGQMPHFLDVFGRRGPIQKLHLGGETAAPLGSLSIPDSPAESSLPPGRVRTKDRLFSSIQELIDFHLRSTTPIRSADSELKLVFPVSSNCLDQ